MPNIIQYTQSQTKNGSARDARRREREREKGAKYRKKNEMRLKLIFGRRSRWNTFWCFVSFCHRTSIRGDQMAAKSVAHTTTCKCKKYTLKIHQISTRSSSAELGMLDHVLYCVQNLKTLTDSNVCPTLISFSIITPRMCRCVWWSFVLTRVMYVNKKRCAFLLRNAEVNLMRKNEEVDEELSDQYGNVAMVIATANINHA